MGNRKFGVKDLEDFVDIERFECKVIPLQIAHSVYMYAHMPIMSVYSLQCNPDNFFLERVVIWR